MNDERAFERAMLANPHDLVLRMVFADWLEERGDPRGELLRLTHTLNQEIDVPRRPTLEARLRALVHEGVRAVGPFWTNSIGMRFAWIPPGTFWMGSPRSEQEKVRKKHGAQIGHWVAQETRHLVVLTAGFFLAIHPVTQAQWQAVMGRDPSESVGDDLPEGNVTWYDAIDFCNALSDKEGKSPAYKRWVRRVDLTGGNGYLLATEAQWEYACRAGSSTAYCCGNSYTRLGDYAWCEDNSSGHVHPVGQKKPNAFGLYDMHGNIWEWCWDRYTRDFYELGPERDPVNSTKGDSRVSRGGSHGNSEPNGRSASRSGAAPSYRGDATGFRVALCAETTNE